jgi:hypothetical protein
VQTTTSCCMHTSTSKVLARRGTRLPRRRSSCTSKLAVLRTLVALGREAHKAAGEPLHKQAHSMLVAQGGLRRTQVGGLGQGQQGRVPASRVGRCALFCLWACCGAAGKTVLVHISTRSPIAESWSFEYMSCSSFLVCSGLWPELPCLSFVLLYCLTHAHPSLSTSLVRLPSNTLCTIKSLYSLGQLFT